MIFSACLLVTHGSSNLNYQIALQKLATLVQQQITHSKTIYQSKKRQNKIALPLVKTACLELTDIPLSQSIINFAQEALAKKYQSVKIIPLFLLSGVHVQEDIPHQINIAQQNLPPLISLELRPHLGSYDSLLRILAQKFAQFKVQKRILLAHGSNWENAHQECEQIASKLEVELAYWSISPTISEKVVSLVSSGVQSIAIVPYFLFEGKITLAIATKIEELKRQYPEIRIYVGLPLGASWDLAHIIGLELLDN